MLAIKDARVLSMNEAGSFEKATVVVDGDSIVELGENPSLAQDCELIHASGKYLLPGFIDSHNHIGLEEEIYRIEGSDVNEIADPITPQLRALDGINFWDLAFTDALRGGVTRSLTMPGSANLIGGQAVFLKHLAARPADMVYKHPWGLKAALGENPKRVYAEQKKSPITRMANASLLREALYTAARNMERVDRTASEVFKQDPLQKVLKQEMPLLVHAHRADDIMTALRIKDEFNIKMIIQHGTEALEVADELQKREVPVFLGPFLINRAKVELKEVSFKTPALLAQRGVKFSLISDHPVVPIEHLRVCAALAVREGLDEELALKALSLWPAEILGVSQELGSIAKGKKADLVVYSGHPLEFRSRVEMLLVDGIKWRG